MVKMVCPTCKSALSPVEGAHVCAGCRASWPVREGVPSFAADEYAHDDALRQQLRLSLATIRDQGWEAFQRAAAASRPARKLLRYAFDAAKADGRLLVELDGQDVVLDVGCGVGTLTYPFARKVGAVYAVDPTLEYAQFVRARREAEGVSNVFPVHASALALPFDGPCFDLVVLNGVLEWVPASGPSGRPREVQRRVLAALAGLLRPGGMVYVAIENRLGCQFLTGAKDHGGCRFTSLLPRWLASALSLIQKGHRYRAYTYTWPGYQRLFRDAGLAVERVYAAFPDYRRMHCVCELRDVARVLDTLRRHGTAVQMALIAAGVALRRPWLFVPAFVFLLRREATDAPGV